MTSGPILSLALALCVLVPAAGHAQDQKRLNIEDYFLMLPAGPYLQGSAREQLKYIRDNKQGVIDIANGYISLNGYGEQPSIQVTFFADRADSVLVAVCYGLMGKPDFTHLAFFEQAPDPDGGLTPQKRLVPVKRDIFPVGNAPSGAYFGLPREGKTITLYDQTSSAVRRRFTWGEERFREVK